MRNITVEGRIIIFKTLALSKMVYLTLMTSFSKQLIEELQRIQKSFTWNNFTPKFKNETLCNSFEVGGFKKVDINSKITYLQFSWIKPLYDDKFHEWELIPLHLIKSTFGIKFKFHSNVDFDDSKILTFPSFYKQLFRNWCKYLSYSVNIPSSILSQPIWYNKNIKINSKPIYVEEFAKQNIIFLYDLFNTKNELKTWDEIKVTYELSDKSYFKWRQIINSVPKTWKKILKENQSDSSNLVLLDHQLLKNNRTLGIEKMNSKEIYSIIISSKVNIPTSREFSLERYIHTSA